MSGSLTKSATSPRSSSRKSSGRYQVPACPPSGWRRFRMRFRPSSLMECSMGRRGVDFGGHAPPGPGLHCHLQWVHRGWSPKAIHALGESLLPHAQLVAKQVSAQWVMDARCTSVAEGVRQEDVPQSTDGVEAGSKVNIILPPTEPNVAPSESEQLLSSPVAPSADAAGRPQ